MTTLAQFLQETSLGQASQEALDDMPTMTGVEHSMTTDTPIYHRLLDEFANTYPCEGDPREGGYYPGCDCIKCQVWKLGFARKLGFHP